MSSYIIDVVDAVDALSSEGLLGDVLPTLKLAGDWADAVAKLIGLVN